MIDWVHQYCLMWGDYIRMMPRAWPSKSTNWKLWREQGARSEQFVASCPTWDMSENVLSVHRAYLEMPEHLRDTMDACYAVKGEPAKRAQSIGVSRSKMYENRGHCHYFIAGSIVEKKNSGICATSE